MSGEPPKFVTMICDASHCPYTNATGWAVWIKHGSPAKTERLSGSTRTKDSTKAERYALLKGSLYLIENVDLQDAIVIVQSDCRGALGKVDVGLFKQRGARHVKLKWVRGHQGVKDPRSAVNTWCDTEAKAQMRPLRDRIYASRIPPNIYSPKESA